MGFETAILIMREIVIGLRMDAVMTVNEDDCRVLISGQYNSVWIQRTRETAERFGRNFTESKQTRQWVIS